MPEPTSVEPSPALRGTVLYIEDDPLNVAMVEAMLARHPEVQLVHAACGIDGVRLARNGEFDFVLLDMWLPDISGLEVVRQLCDQIAERRLRVTILTGDSLSMDVIKALSLGAFEYLVKPVDARQLEHSVRLALTRERPR